jgi:NAD-dependent dihydropyrimidine dehydrogenase PreA subunit
MRNAIIYTFSGTGNTMLAAKSIKKELSMLDIIADIVEISNPYQLDKQPSDYDIVGIGYPIHAFNCPKIVIDFIKSLSISEKKYTFVFKTSGEPFKFNYASSYILKRALIKEGLDINTEMHILMPYNIVFRYKDELVKQMLKYMYAMTKVLAIKISKAEQDMRKFNIRQIILSYVFRIQWGGAILNGRIYCINKKRCTDCDLCVKNCPSKNIYRDKNNKIKFDSACTMCMRCAMDCPENAINIGILNLWKVNGKYNFNKIYNDEDISTEFVDNAAGYFKLFSKFFSKAKTLCEKYNVDIE